MNKYIRKCLIVYTSLALVLVGMAGAAYAITATDADQYVTRSQYAVDMAHLQNKLDEKEAGLMGNINRYRSTDVKFVTYDSPTKYQQDSQFSAGYHNGGNFFPRRPRLDTIVYMFSPRTNSIGNMAKQSNNSAGANIIYYMWRLYNGNYMFNRAQAVLWSGSTPRHIGSVVIYAIPVENFSGWYLINRIIRMQGTLVRNYSSLVKLDPDSPYSGSDIYGKTIQVRFKKDLFVSGCYDNRSPLTGTSATDSLYWQADSSTVIYNNPFYPLADFNQGANVSSRLNIVNNKDSETGDWVTSITGMTPYGQGYVGREYFINSSYYPAQRLIPKDNVEYVMGPTWSAASGLSEHSEGIPPANGVGKPDYTFTTDNKFWRYEFVDCINGIKYWHAMRSPDNAPSENRNPQTIHYSLPIVY